MGVSNAVMFSLSYHHPMEDQEFAINHIIMNADEFSEDDIGELIDRGCKETWPNTIKVLSLLGYPKIKKAIPSLFGLFQDLTWPGSMDAFRLLGTLDPKVYSIDLNNTIKTALDDNDDCWISGISAFVKKFNLHKYIQNDLRESFERMVKEYDEFELPNKSGLPNDLEIAKLVAECMVKGMEGDCKEL